MFWISWKIPNLTNRIEADPVTLFSRTKALYQAKKNNFTIRQSKDQNIWFANNLRLKADSQTFFRTKQVFVIQSNVFKKPQHFTTARKDCQKRISQVIIEEF